MSLLNNIRLGASWWIPGNNTYMVWWENLCKTSRLTLSCQLHFGLPFGWRLRRWGSSWFSSCELLLFLLCLTLIPSIGWMHIASFWCSIHDRVQVAFLQLHLSPLTHEELSLHLHQANAFPKHYHQVAKIQGFRIIIVYFGYNKSVIIVIMKSDNDLPIMVLDSEKDSEEIKIMNYVRYALK